MTDGGPNTTLSVSKQEIDTRNCTFRILPDGGSPYTVILNQRIVNIGSEKQEVSIAAPGIVAYHARLQQEGNTYRLYVLTAAAQVLVNNQPVEGSVLLKDGDVLRLQNKAGQGATLAYSNPVERAMGSETVGQLYPFERFPFTIGRNPTCNVQLKTLAVSQVHATITEQGNAHILTDNGSKNGTFVNDKRISGPYRLRPDDVIRIDQVLLVYKGKGLMRLAATQTLEIDAYNLGMTYRTGFMGRKTLNTMREVSIAVQPKELVAIIGGSGSGKSTLLKALNGAQRATEGKVLINGSDLYAEYDIFQPSIGYVPQQDIVQDTLSIYQTLYYGARMRFPNENDDSIEERIVRVLEAVELTDYKDRLVGQLSGGQRKRVSIALELMAEPIMLFMDEPSSGLDPGLDRSMMLTLRKLADRGHIVLVVTHTTLNIELCDQLAIMARGNLVWYGPPREALAFFDARDYPEIYNKVQQSPEDEAAANETMIFRGNSGPVQTAKKISPFEAAAQWAKRYRASPTFNKIVGERLKTHGASLANTALTNTKLRRSREGSFWQQARTLTERTIAIVRRDMRTILSLLLVLPLVGLFLGLISFDTVESQRGQMLVSRGSASDYLIIMDKLPLKPVATVPPAAAAPAPAATPEATPAPSRTSPGSAAPQISKVGTFTPASDAQRVLFIVALAVTLFGIFASAYTIVSERPLYLRERMVNLRIAPYLTSKFVVYGALAMFSSLLALVTLSFGVRIPDQGMILWGPLEMFITMALTALAGVSLGLVLSAIAKHTNAVTYLVLGVLFVQILFPGVLFPMEGVLEPVSRLTITRWSLEALGGTADMIQRNAEGRIVVEQNPINPKTGKPLKTVARQFFPAPPSLSVSYPFGPSDLLVRWAALIGFSVVFLLLGGFILRRGDDF